MIRRIIAAALIICCLFSAVPAWALEENDIEVVSGLFEAEVPLAEGDSGAEGLVIDLGDAIDANPENEALSEAEIPETVQEDALFPGAQGAEMTDAVEELAVPLLFAAARINTQTLSLVLDRENVSLVPGSSVQIKAAYENGGALNAEWMTGDPAVAVVDVSGRVTAVGTGETMVTALDEYGMSAQCCVKVSQEINAIAFDCDTFYLGAGETSGALRVYINDGCAETYEGYTLTTSKPKYVRLNADGTLKGVKKGSSTVTVSTEGGLSDTVKVVVGTAPSKITASPKSITIGLGETAQLGYKLPSGCRGSVSFQSLNEACVSVDTGSGMVKGIAPGTAKVKITTYNKKTCTVTVKVVNAPESLTLSQTELVLAEGMTNTLKASVNAGSAGKITWESSNPDIARVENGKVTAVAQGTAAIYARTYVDGVYAECSVEVKPAPQSVSFPVKKIYIGIGEKVQLKPDVGDSVGGFKYSSSKKEYATVSSAGVVKGKKKGSTTITVKTYNGKKTTLKVTVGNAPKKITASPVTLGLGETGVLKYKLTSGSYSAVTFENRNPEYVSVDPATGNLQALMQGSAAIGLKTFNGKKTTANISVLNAPEKVHMSHEQLIIGAGQSISITASVNEGAASAITWESGDSGIASVKDGKITGVAPGMTAITAKTYVEGVTGVCQVLVKPAPAKVTLPSKKIYLGVGDSYLIVPDVGDSVGGFKYSSSDKKIAKVSSDGVVKGVKTGTAKITVKTYNGKKATLTVVVQKAPGKITPQTKRIELGIGETCTIGYKLPSKTRTTVTFTCPDAGILNVDERTGLVNALSPGETQVRMRTHNGKEAFTEVGVFPAPEWIKLNCEALTMGVGQVFTLRPSIPEESRSAIRFFSSDENVVKVKADGAVTAVKKGSAEIRVETCNVDVFAVIPVEVLDAPTQMSLNVSDVQMNVNESMKLEAIIPEGTMAD
ncbi:MAG: Ig-like domain-containing protein [Clostridia bacterium]|nr:Ig-like domain-containing protein [Clostridia bacterium]